MDFTCMSVLAAKQLTLWRGSLCLFENLSFQVKGGSALLVQGPNGSGKTSLLRVLCGLSRPESGTVHWNYESIESSRSIFGAQIAYFGHITGLKADLTARQNLIFVARMLGQDDQAWENYLEPLSLLHCANLPVRYLSAGQQRRTALARVLMSDARLWLMDEPFTNLDQAGRDFIEEQLMRHLDGGGLAVVVAHHGLDLPRESLTTVQLGEMN
jgi:heme exporter protein A